MSVNIYIYTHTCIGWKYLQDAATFVNMMIFLRSGMFGLFGVFLIYKNIIIFKHQAQLQ